MNHKCYSGGYESHFPILAAAVAMTKGPVIEFGCGWFSTPMLHAMCRAMKRRLDTIESDKGWLNNFRWMETDDSMVHMLHVGEWGFAQWIQPIKWSPEDTRRWGVCFIDYKPGEERKDIAAFMADKADLVLCHDSEKDYNCGADYKYEDILHLYKYKTEYRLMRPYTLILSNTMEFPLSEEEQTWHPENVQ